MRCGSEYSEERHGSGRGEVVLQLYKQRLERQVLVFFLATNERFFHDETLRFGVNLGIIVSIPSPAFGFIWGTLADSSAAEMSPFSDL